MMRPTGSRTTPRQRRLGGAALTSETISYDASGNATIVSTAVDRDAHLVTQTTDTPGSSTDGLALARAGLTQLSRTGSGLVYRFGFDGLGRRTTVVDPRSGEQTTDYDALGRVETVKDAAGNDTNYGYDSSSGRLKSVSVVRPGSDPATTIQTYYGYNARGQTTRVWGDGPQPVEYGYDDYGQRTSLKTWRTLPASNSQWTDDEWPSSPGTADETTWTFDAATGLLTSKTYADATHVDYTYRSDGRMAVRTWARLDENDDPLTTTYRYYGDSSGFSPPSGYSNDNTGELGMIDYSDGTPDVKYGYTRSGRLGAVEDATGTRAFAYNADLSLDSETLDEDFFGSGRVITRLYSAGGTGEPPAGWPTGLKVGGETPEYATGYYYDAASGRLERVTGPGLPGYGVVYGFVADSDLVGVIDYNTDASTTLLRTTRLIEDHRDLVDSVENKWVGSSGNTVVSKYDYTNDDIGRRTGVTRTGAAFPTTQPVAWKYNDRSELTDERLTDEADMTDDERAKRHVAYSYDAIGNRTFAPAGESRFVRIPYQEGTEEDPPVDAHDEPAATTNYLANALNQYQRVQRPYGTADFKPFSQRLTYDADGNLSLVEKFGDANCDGVVDNFDIDAFVAAVINTTLETAPSSYTTAGGTQTCWDARAVWGDMNGDSVLDNFDIDPFVYSLIADYQPVVCYKRYVWDAENRLIRVEPMNTPTTSGVERWVYVYDYLGRRVEKRRELWSTSGGGHWAADSTIRLVYDGWNVIEILDASGEGDPVVIRKQTWGLDLSGQSGSAGILPAGQSPPGIHGAGGIGGLLGVQIESADPSTSESGAFAYLYDANGNVGQMVALVSGYGGASSDEWHGDRLAAKYEYDPYGNLTNTPSAFGLTNAYRFSTKWYDAETGWLYYGRRPLITALGRWGNHDPIGEQGGMNLYAFVRNGPSIAYDAVGLQDTQGTSQPCCNTCGPDITIALHSSLEAAKNYFSTAPRATRMQICNGIIGAAGWDFDALKNERARALGCATGSCRGTVSVGGICWHSTEVNYSLWGLLNCLCSRSLSDTLFGATAWKKLRHGRTNPEAESWTDWGFAEGGCPSTATELLRPPLLNDGPGGVIVNGEVTPGEAGAWGIVKPPRYKPNKWSHCQRCNDEQGNMVTWWGRLYPAVRLAGSVTAVDDMKSTLLTGGYVEGPVIGIDGPEVIP